MESSYFTVLLLDQKGVRRAAGALEREGKTHSAGSCHSAPPTYHKSQES
jgi:hypothetical protein